MEKTAVLCALNCMFYTAALRTFIFLGNFSEDFINKNYFQFNPRLLLFIFFHFDVRFNLSSLSFNNSQLLFTLVNFSIDMYLYTSRDTTVTDLKLSTVKKIMFCSL